MSSDDNVENWLENGAEAFANMRMVEAAQHFERAAAADPGFAKAHLCLGVIKFFEYQNGISMHTDFSQEDSQTLKNGKLGSPPPPRPKIRPLDPATKSARIAEQNATNGRKAEEHLKRALELDPAYEPAMEYLAALYFQWLEPASQGPAQRDAARQWYAHIVETNPHHSFANYLLGLIDYEKAFAFIRSGTGFPRPLTDENRRRSLRAQAGPLLAESARNFQRSLEIDPNSEHAMTYLMYIKADQAYLAEPDEAVRKTTEADVLRAKIYQIMEANAKDSGQSWPPGDKATITFTYMPPPSGRGKPSTPSFPPDARLMTVPPAPPPPPV